jgi:AraC-like DNA-binding protein
MDEPVMELDLSSLPPGPIRAVEISAEPLSPWLRLAHVYNYRTDREPVYEQAKVRVLFDFELIVQLQGVAWIWSEPDGGCVAVPPGAVAFIPPGFVHAWGDPFGVHLAVHFDLHAEPRMGVPANMRVFDKTVQYTPISHVPRFELQAGDDPSPAIVRLVTPPSISNPWRERLIPLVELWSRRAGNTLERGVVTAAALGSVLSDLAAEGGEGSGPDVRQPDSRILDVLRILDNPESTNLPHRPTVAQLAELANLGEAAFRAAFVRTMGCGPRRYLEERRVQHAARALLETDRSVTEIANSVGYDDPYHFSRVFRRVTGMSPRKYRNNKRTEAADPEISAQLSEPAAVD